MPVVTCQRFVRLGDLAGEQSQKVEGVEFTQLSVSGEVVYQALLVDGELFKGKRAALYVAADKQRSLGVLKRFADPERKA